MLEIDHAAHATRAQVLAAVPRFPGVSVTLLSHCQCEASDGAPEFVDLAFKLAILSGSSAGLSSMAALNPDTPLSAIWQQAVRLWTQQLQGMHRTHNSANHTTLHIAFTSSCCFSHSGGAQHHRHHTE